MAAKYHGRVVDCSQEGWEAELPERRVLQETAAVREWRGRLAAGEPIYFLPDTFTDRLHTPPDAERASYSIFTVGVMPCGTKVAINITGVWPELEVRVPEELPAASFRRKLEGELREARVWFRSTQLEEHYPLKGWSEREVSYVKIIFGTHMARGAALKFVKSRGYETAIDDKNPYFRVAARQAGYATCGWNEVRNYTREERGTVAHQAVPFCLTVHIKHFTALKKDLSLPENRYLAEDRSLLMCYDLETYNRRNTSRAPLPDEIYLQEEGVRLKPARMKEMRPGDLQGLITMACCTFGWYYDREPSLFVCITYLPLPPMARCLVVQVPDQEGILQALATLVGRMRPEFCTGFNDGLYDWPFIHERVKAYGMETLYRECFSNLNHANQEERSAKWEAAFASARFKLEAGQDVELVHYKAPGLVCMDTRAIFRKLLPGTELSSLNFYLEKHKLKLKEDMEIGTMNRVVRVVRQITAALAVRSRCERGGEERLPTYDEVLAYTDRWKAGARPYERLEHAANSVDPSTYGVERLTTEELRELVTKAVLVAEYCCTDAASCHRLLHTRKVINDKRESGNLSFTDIYDCCTRADGMRVRSVIIAEAIKPQWNIAVSNYVDNPQKTDDKYPGAYVLHPSKGLYRDTAAVKARRKEQSADQDPTKDLGSTKDPGSTKDFGGAADPDGSTRDPGGNAEFERLPPATAALLTCNDDNQRTDRPTTGLDFSSLYPSVVMDDNCSPEKVIYEEATVRRLTTPDGKGRMPLDRWGHPYRFRKVQFRYGKKGDREENKALVVAWIVQCTPIVKLPDGREVSVYELTPEQIQKKPSILRYDGFGIYAHVLKMLFDMRATYKRSMEEYGGPLKFMVESFIKTTPLAGLKEVPVAEQWSLLLASLDREQDKRTKEYEAKPKDYFKHRLKEIKELRAYFTKFALLELPPLLVAFYSELEFNEGYFNRKQNIMKVFMNTFYGETGNTQSAFFMVEVAGAITTGGQKALKTVRTFVEEEGYRALYGDTDSLYLCCPEKIFEAIDAAYVETLAAAATIKDKKQAQAARLAATRLYWEQMIEITMEDLTQLKDRVNYYLFTLTLKYFLKMAYEEVLWPYMKLGKKKYAGIQHLGIPNLAACDPAMSLENFRKDRSLFIRGLELKKRGSSEFLKLICFEVLQRSFCLTNTQSLLEIVYQILREVPERQWDNKVFIKTARYKLPGRGKNGELKPGNRVVLPFMDRMIALQKAHPALGIGPTELGDRFEYINAKRQPWRYSESGRKIKIGANERVEFVWTIGHRQYEALVGPVVPDIQHYICGEVIGQLSRFVNYHPRFIRGAAAAGRCIPDARHVDLEDENEADDFYKQLDDIAFKAAKRELTNFYNVNFGEEWPDDSKEIRTAYRQAAKLMYSSWQERCGDLDDAMFLLEKAIQERQTNLKPIISKTIVEAAKKRAKQLADSPCAALRAAGFTAYQIHKIYVSGGILQRRRRMANEGLRTTMVTLGRLLPVLERICQQEQHLLHRLLDGENLTEAEDDEVEPEADVPYLTTLQTCFLDLCCAHISLLGCDRFEQDIKNERERTVGASPIPTAVREQLVQETRTKNRDLREWLNRKNVTLSFG